MPKKLNKAGNMQEFVPAGNGDASGEFGNEQGENKHFTNFKKQEDNETENKINEIKKKAKDLGFKDLAKLGKMDSYYKFRELVDAGIPEKEVLMLQKHYREKQKIKNEHFKDMFHNAYEKKQKNFFGDDVRLDKDRIQFTKYKDNDNATIFTNNVQYWKNKDAYVLWVDNDKVVYLKEFQLQPIHVKKTGLNGYAVKLNRKFFKPYRSYTNTDMAFTKETTFDDILEIAKEQDKEDLVFKKDFAN